MFGRNLCVPDFVPSPTLRLPRPIDHLQTTCMGNADHRGREKEVHTHANAPNEYESRLHGIGAAASQLETKRQHPEPAGAIHCVATTVAKLVSAACQSSQRCICGCEQP